MEKVGAFLSSEPAIMALECPLTGKKCTLTEKVSEIAGKVSPTVVPERLTAGIE